MAIFVTFIVAILNIILGFFVFLKNPKGATHRYYLSLSIVVALWAVTNHFSLQMRDPAETLFWIRAVMVITSYLGPSLYLMALSFPNHELKLSKLKKTVLLVASAASALLAATPLMFSKVEYINGSIQPTPGPGILVYAVIFFSTIVGAFVTLWKKYRRSAGLEKLQLRYLFLGIVSTFTLLAVTNFIFVLLLRISNFVIFGPVFTLFLVASIGYAIVKHRFLDISLLVARSVTYVSLVLLLTGFYVGTLFTVENYLTSGLSGSQETLISTALGMIVVFTLQPLRLFLEQLTQRIFYRHHYDSDTVLNDISSITSNELELEKLLQGTMSILVREMKLDCMVALLANGDVDVYRTNTDNGSFCSITNKSEKIELKRRLDFLHARSDESVIVFDELNESNDKKMLRNLEIAVVIPLIVNKEVIGHLLSKTKLSGEAFTTQDLRIFELIGPQVAISVKNASSFEEIRRFNIKLTEEVRRATANLRHANERLKELDKLKDEFVSIASHELRTPMAAIKSFLWMALAGKAGHMPAKMREFVQRSYDSTERLINLVNDMLNVSRIEAGRVSVNLAKTDLHALAKDVVAEMKGRAAELHVNLKIASPDDQHVWAIADGDKIKEVLLNFVGNSLKFTPPKGTVTISWTQQDDLISTHVTDTGVGISKDGLEHLFEKFGLMQGSYRTNKPSTQGTGLGLYICKSIIELHQGKVSATSEGEGKGATFTFALPAYSAPALEEAKRGQKSKPTDVTIIHRAI